MHAHHHLKTVAWGSALMAAGVGVLAIPASFVLFPNTQFQRVVASSIEVAFLLVPVLVGILIARRAPRSAIQIAAVCGLVCGLALSLSLAAIFQQPLAQWSVYAPLGAAVLAVLGAAAGRLLAR